MILPGAGLGMREEFPREKVVWDGVFKYIPLPGKLYATDMREKVFFCASGWVMWGRGRKKQAQIIIV